jgi:hypothetical protein
MIFANISGIHEEICIRHIRYFKPLESMPEDIHESIWKTFRETILPSGIIAVTQEIYDEMGSIQGSVG